MVQQSEVIGECCTIYSTPGINFDPGVEIAHASPIECLKLRNDPELLMQISKAVVDENPYPKRGAGVSSDDFGEIVYRWVCAVMKLRNERFRQQVTTSPEIRRTA